MTRRSASLNHPHLRLVKRLPPPPEADRLDRFIGDVDIIDLRGTAVPDRVDTWQSLGFVIRRLLAQMNITTTPNGGATDHDQ